MPVEAAQIVFAVIFTIATLVWAVSLRKAARLGRLNQSNPWANVANPSSPAWDNANTRSGNPWAVDSLQPVADTQQVTGQQTVQGQAADVSAAIAEKVSLVGVPGRFSGLFEVIEQNRDRVSVRKTGSLVCNQPTGLYFSEADFELKQIGNGTTEVQYTLGFERLGRGLRRIALAIILVLGLPALLILSAVLWVFVVNSDNPIIRWQVIQGLQVVHVLWPPFLLLWFYGAGKKHSRTYVSNLLRSIQPRRGVEESAFAQR